MAPNTPNGTDKNVPRESRTDKCDQEPGKAGIGRSFNDTSTDSNHKPRRSGIFKARIHIGQQQQQQQAPASVLDPTLELLVHAGAIQMRNSQQTHNQTPPGNYSGDVQVEFGENSEHNALLEQLVQAGTIELQCSSTSHGADAAMAKVKQDEKERMASSTSSSHSTTGNNRKAGKIRTIAKSRNSKGSDDSSSKDEKERLDQEQMAQEKRGSNVLSSLVDAGRIELNNHNTNTVQEQEPLNEADRRPSSTVRYDDQGQPLKGVLPTGAARPGAYSGAPGADYNRNSSLQFDLVGNHEDIDSSSDMNSAVLLEATEQRQSKLALTNLGRVEESTHSVDSESNENDDNDNNTMSSNKVDGQQWYQHKKYVMLGVAACVVVLVVIILVVVLAAGGGGSSSQESSTSNSEAPQQEEDAPPVPTEMDVFLVPGLPSFTVAALQDYTTPQAQALAWAMSDSNWESYEPWRKQQRYALSTFYYSFGGPQWPQSNPQATNWLDYNLHECTWFDNDNACNDHGNIEVLNITRLSGFRGTVPPEIVVLDHLHTIDLSNNILNIKLAELLPLEQTDAIPSSLKVFSCIMCRLHGSIPSDLGRLTDLQELNLYDNSLTGNIPPAISDMKSLRRLSLTSNSLTGSLPTDIGRLTSLTSLELTTNSLSSSIPTEIGYLSNIHGIYFGYNSFSGAIPSTIGLLTMLEWADFESNHLSGQLSTEVGLATNLFRLDIQDARLSGTLPSELGLLSKLTLLGLSKNTMQGSLPTHLGLMVSTMILDLSINKLTGSVPSQLGLLTKLQELRLFENELTGAIPEEVKNIPNLNFFI